MEHNICRKFIISLSNCLNILRTNDIFKDFVRTCSVNYNQTINKARQSTSI